MPCDVDQPNVDLFEVFGGCVLDRRRRIGVLIPILANHNR